MAEIEPELTSKTNVAIRSEWLGFPPVACPRKIEGTAPVQALKHALLTMKNDKEGKEVLRLLRLDGFSDEEPSLFDTIAAEMELVRGLG
jgi:phosphonate transport system substrate-binding protein